MDRSHNGCNFSLRFAHFTCSSLILIKYFFTLYCTNQFHFSTRDQRSQSIESIGFVLIACVLRTEDAWLLFRRTNRSFNSQTSIARTLIVCGQEPTSLAKFSQSDWRKIKTALLGPLYLSELGVLLSSVECRKKNVKKKIEKYSIRIQWNKCWIFQCLPRLQWYELLLSPWRMTIFFRATEDTANI